MGSRQGRLPSVAIFSLLLLTTSVAAQPVGDTLAGKSVAMIIGFGPGGGYDLWGRTVGRHIGRHLPGTPTVVPQNMPGAGGIVVPFIGIKIIDMIITMLRLA